MAAPLTLQELETLRAKLVRARLNGTRSVRDQNGEELTWKSDAEMSAALASIDAEIARLSQAQVRTVKFETTKG